MRRLANLDIGSRSASGTDRTLRRLGFGLACTACMIGARALTDTTVPGAGPFALIYPTILIATLFGHWTAGLVTSATTLCWVWWHVLPPQASFRLIDAAAGERLLVNVVCSLITVALAESFRSAVRAAVTECDRAAELNDALRRELEHRIKNNFQIVLGLLEHQMRRARSQDVRSALQEAIGRLQSVTGIYTNLPIAPTGQQIEMRAYLSIITQHVASAVFGGAVHVTVEVDDISLGHDEAMAVGLFANEALTNCAKHAFPDGRGGTIRVRLSGTSHAWKLFIQDDGAGRTGERRGTGSSLMETFAAQAHARHEVVFSEEGCAATLTKGPRQTL